MFWPLSSSDIIIASEESHFKVAAYATLYLPFVNDTLTVELVDLKKEQMIPEGGYVFMSSWFNFYISNNFITDHFLAKSPNYLKFIEQLKSFYTLFSNLYDPVAAESYRYSMFSFFYKTAEQDILHFQLPNNTSEELLLRSQIAFEAINNTRLKIDQNLNPSLEEVFTQDNKVKYIKYIENRWTVINPLDVITGTINLKYSENADKRVGKPDILIQHDNLNRTFTFGDNWVLETDRLSTLLIKPNDISMYSGISEKNLKTATEFYDRVIAPRHKNLYNPFPAKNIQIEYLDFFELIITAVVSAYTALEAMSNMCIPEGYTFTDKDGIIHTRLQIERYFPLRDKFKLVLKVLYKTPDPTKEKWWSKFKKLEDIRNTIIHAKPSRSNDRYAQFLKKEIFTFIQIHKTIISFYGRYIYLNGGDMINIIPYGFGFDQVYPILIDDAEYRRIYNNLHNPHNPL